MEMKIVTDTTPDPFFPSKVEGWEFMSGIADDLYKMMNTINRDYAALAHIGEETADLATLRYLVRRCWLHYHERDDALFTVYQESPEFE